MGKGVVEVDSPPLHPQAPTTHVWVELPVRRPVQEQLQVELLKGVDVWTEWFDRKARAAWCGCQGLVLVDEVMEELDPQDPQHPYEPA